MSSTYYWSRCCLESEGKWTKSKRKTEVQIWVSLGPPHRAHTLHTHSIHFTTVVLVGRSLEGACACDRGRGKTVVEGGNLADEQRGSPLWTESVWKLHSDWLPSRRPLNSSFFFMVAAAIFFSPPLFILSYLRLRKKTSLCHFRIIYHALFEPFLSSS